MHPLVTWRKPAPAAAASPESGGVGPGGRIGDGGSGGCGCGCGCGGCCPGSGPGSGSGGLGGQRSVVTMLLLSLTGPGVVPVTVATLGTTDGTQSAPAVVF